MSTSGSWDFTLDIAEIVEEAFERTGGSARNGYHYRTARRSLDLLLLEWQNRGLNLFTVKSTSQALTAGTASYTLSNEKLDIIEALLRTDEGSTTAQTDLHMKRVSISAYARQTNKLLTGRPTQYWIERAPEAITVHVWPVPDSSDYTLFYYFMEKIEDSGKPGSNTIDVPARYLPALTAGLAYYLALKTPSAFSMAAGLKAVYDEQWTLASDAARDKSNMFMQPWIGRV